MPGFEWHSVPSFGGGLNFDAHPGALQDDQWSWCDGWVARDGYAEVRPRYFKQNAANTWLNPATFTPLGIMLDNLAGAGVSGNLLAVSFENASQDAYISRVTPAGAVAAIAPVGVRPSATALYDSHGTINGQQVIALGPSAVSPSTVALYNGVTFARINPAGGLHGLVSCIAAGHVILGNEDDASGSFALPRTLAWSDASDPTTWVPATANSADDVILDSEGIILGVVPVPDGFVVLTTLALFRGTSTGSIPAFTIQRFQERGGRNFAQIIHTPDGVFHDGMDDIYPLGGEGISRRVYRYWASQAPIPRLRWHRTLGCLLLSTANEVLFVDPSTGAWSRQSYPVAAVTHEASVDLAANPEGDLIGLHSFMAANGDIYREDAIVGTAAVGAFVDTKDFGGADGPRYVDQIRVDWEPLTDRNNDSIEVLAYTRNDLSRDDTTGGILGASGAQMDLTTKFVSQGFLTGGAANLTLRKKGRWTRFRFKQTSGRARIRGFHLRTAVGGDRG